ncbi:MAG TPA: hypothetical protein VM711_08915, partial [Sphingomicrobium sp.]|nr:hypothetical protein [Sphingomicrobium sp.]
MARASAVIACAACAFLSAIAVCSADPRTALVIVQGPAATNKTLTEPSGEFFLDVDGGVAGKLRLGDGVTPGGKVIYDPNAAVGNFNTGPSTAYTPVL